MVFPRVLFVFFVGARSFRSLDYLSRRPFLKTTEFISLRSSSSYNSNDSTIAFVFFKVQMAREVLL